MWEVEAMSVIGLRVGPYEIVAPATIPEVGDWYTATRVGTLSREPGATPPRETNEVLIHLLPSDASAEARAQSARAFEVLRGVNDPRIPAPLGWYEGSGALAFPSLPGVSLYDLWPYRSSGQVPMPPATILDFGVELADLLVRAHNRNLIHGRLDASRIWIGPDGRLSIWGFALNPAVSADPLWTAPERARGEPTTPATDQWSLGMVLAGLILAEAPWSNATGNPLDAARRGNVDTVLTRIEGQWPAFARLLRRMTESNPDERFPWMHNVRRELSDLSRVVGGTSLRRAIGARLVRAVAAEAVDRPPSKESPPPPQANLPSASIEQADGSPTLVAMDVEGEPDETTVETEDLSVNDASPPMTSESEKYVAIATVEFDDEHDASDAGENGADPASARTEPVAPSRHSAPNLTLPAFFDEDPPSAASVIEPNPTSATDDHGSEPSSSPLWSNSDGPDSIGLSRHALRSDSLGVTGILSEDSPSGPVFDPAAAQRQVDTTRQDLPSLPAASPHLPMSHELPSWPAFPTGLRHNPMLADNEEPPSVHIPAPDNALVKRVAPWLAGFMVVSLIGLLLWQLSA